MPDSTPGQRFIQLIQQLGLTKNAFAQSLGKTATVIQHIVDERNKPGYDLMNRICETYPNVSGEWLLRGLGPMLREGAPAGPSRNAGPAPLAGGIDLSEVPNASRRRSGNLLQPADIAATLALASQPHNGHSQASALPPAVPTPTPAPVPAPVATPSSVAAETPPAAVASQPPPTPAPTLPDPAYLAAALHTQHLQHQLALTEQRNQHLLEQQTLLRQMVELLQR